jgi:hypothetical protein
MTPKINAVVQDSCDFNGSISRDSIEDKMPWLLDSARRPRHSIPAEPKMVCAHLIANLGPSAAAVPRGVIRDIAEGPKQQGFVTQPPALAELLLRPPEYSRDVLFGLWRY